MALALVPAAAAWACLGLAGLTTNATGATQPGSTIQVKGVEFGSNPVQLHLDAIDGPVLATINPVSGNFTQSLTLPADLSTGPHVLVATEAAATTNGLNNGAANGTPARALIQVGSPAAAPASSTARVATLAQSSNSGSVGTLILIALAVAGAGLFLAGGAIFVASSQRRRSLERQTVAG
jgi:hypothetical protein